eukprot:2871981-Rhodomonas_salina.1
MNIVLMHFGQRRLTRFGCFTSSIRTACSFGTYQCWCIPLCQYRASHGKAHRRIPPYAMSVTGIAQRSVPWVHQYRTSRRSPSPFGTSVPDIE